MENNIFEGAYFGKAFKARDGRKALYIKYNKDSYDPEIPHQLIYENGGSAIQVDNFGNFWGKDKKSCDDIISEWLDEEELDKLAHAFVDNNELLDNLHISDNADVDDLVIAYKAGFRSKL